MAIFLGLMLGGGGNLAPERAPTRSSIEEQGGSELAGATSQPR